MLCREPPSCLPHLSSSWSTPPMSSPSSPVVAKDFFASHCGASTPPCSLSATEHEIFPSSATSLPLCRPCYTGLLLRPMSLPYSTRGDEPVREVGLAGWKGAWPVEVDRLGRRLASGGQLVREVLGWVELSRWRERVRIQLMCL